MESATLTKEGFNVEDGETRSEATMPRMKGKWKPGARRCGSWC